MTLFEDLGLKSEVLSAISDLGFEKPMLIQEKVIPLLLTQNQDIVGLAQTGTGKTAAFGLPIINQIDTSKNYVQAIILCPTRELCNQITKDLESYTKYLEDIKTLAVYGGANIEPQIRSLKRGVHIVVATPGRMQDLINRGVADLSKVETLVLDEADEMLNMGFIDSLNEILKSIPKTRKTLLFSATMPREVATIAKKYMNDPIEIVAGEKNSSSVNVRHLSFVVKERDRYLTLKRIVDYYPDIYGIVFCRTRRETKEVSENLIRDGYNADALHGDLSQPQRDYVMQRFRLKNIQLLIATDVAARGLDVNDLTHVINYNLPDSHETYNHRSGRTGRAGKKGISIIISKNKDLNEIKRIERSINNKFELTTVPKGSEICEKQLFFHINKMEEVAVDDTQIEEYLPKVYEKLANLSKEDIIKRFVSLEFNRFLNYYRDAEDIEDSDYKKGSGRDDRDDRDRGGRKRDRDGRGGDRDRSDRGRGDRDRGRGDRDRGGRGDRDRDDRKRDKDRGDKKSKKSDKPEKGFVKFRMGLGRDDDLFPNVLIDLINQTTLGKRVKVGKIDFTNKDTFFDVSEEHSKQLLKELKNVFYKGKKVKIESM